MQNFQDNPKVDYHLARKVYFIILFFSLIWLLLVFAAPVLAASGGVYSDISSYIYIFFSSVCHQDDLRSFHIFGYELAVCSRCVSIYTGFFFGAVLYPVKFRLNNVIPPSVWFLIAALLLMLIDVLLDNSGYWSNTFLTRSLTGFVMGIVLPFYLIPGFVKFYYEVHSFLRKKISV